MKNILKIKLLPYFILFVCLLIAAGITYTLAPKPKIAGISTKKTNIVISKVQSSPTQIPSLSPTPTIPVEKQLITITPTEEMMTPSSNHSITTAPAQPSATPTQAVLSATPTTTIPPTASPTSTQTAKTVSMQIQTPDGNSTMIITLQDGATVCDILDEAKSEGKISSVTFDDSYMDSLHSKYVVEINGYKNNWTFTVNSNSPAGCSLFNPKPNDSIVWKFG